jgi:hypothetical protein
MAGQAIKVYGTEVTMESAGATLNDGDMPVCADVAFEVANVAGNPMATFEFDTAAGGFSVAPTAGAIINIYEQKFNSDGNQAPVPDATYKADFIGSFFVDVADVQQYLVADCPICFYGGDYVLEWLDGGAGTATVTTGWILRVKPWTYGAAP